MNRPGGRRISNPARARRGRRPDRSGAALLEFALVLPLLMLIVLGCVDFGRFVYTYISVHNGARAGAGAVIDKALGGSVTPGLVTNINVAVQQEMSDFVFPAGFAPDVALIKEGSFRRVRVGVTYPFDTLVPWPGIPSHLDLTHSIEMRLLE